MPDQKSIDDARRWNADLDAALQARGIVDQALYLQFSEAFHYGAASTVGWVEGKLKVLLDRVRQGEELSLFDPSLQETRPVRGEFEFRSWIEEHFAGLSV